MDPWKRILILGICTFLGMTGVNSQGDLCAGSFGDNIFEEGDFGAGNSNVLLQDPNIAPGYTYTTIMPVDDGEYVLTNSTAQWPQIFQTWILIEDNSGDPFGYMMVVNASFEPGIFYEQTVSGLCESTLYEFSADLINMIQRPVQDHIRPNVSFEINGETRFTSGPLPQNEQWNTYGFTFRTGPGQTSVTLTLRNNAPGGIGNDLALDNITFKPCGPLSSISTNTPEGVVCEDQGFPLLTAFIEPDTGFVIQWQRSDDDQATWQDVPGATGADYQIEPLPPANYAFRYLVASSVDNLQNSKCRIASMVLPLRVVPIEYFVIDTICEGTSYRFGERTLSEQGIYIDSFLTVEGCDSIVTLDLTVVPDPGISAEFGFTPPTCSYSEDAIIEILSINNASLPLEIFLDGIPVSSNDSIITSSGSHDITIRDRYACSLDEFVIVPSTPPFNLFVPADREIKLGAMIALGAEANDSIAGITWTPEDGLDCTNCLETNAAPFYTTRYTITAINAEGCVATDSFLVRVNRDLEYFAPNVFSPNNDGINDVWGLFALRGDVTQIEELHVYDRWGGIVMSRSRLDPVEATALWDGTYSGGDCPVGVYTFVARLRRVDDTKFSVSGSVTLVR